MKSDSNKPLYLQVEAAIRNDIATKKYKPGEKLPTEIELGEVYQVSKITIRKAMEKLTSDALVERVRGKGSFVSQKKEKLILGKSKGFSESFVSTGHTTQYKVLSARFLKSDLELSNKLQIKEDSSVVMIERLIWKDHIPNGIDTLYVSDDRFPNIITKLSNEHSLYQTLKDDYHIDSQHATLELNGLLADVETAELLECHIGDPLFQVEKISYDMTDMPIHYSKTLVRCDRVSYLIRVNDQVKMDERSS